MLVGVGVRLVGQTDEAVSNMNGNCSIFAHSTRLARRCPAPCRKWYPRTAYCVETFGNILERTRIETRPRGPI